MNQLYFTETNAVSSFQSLVSQLGTTRPGIVELDSHIGRGTIRYSDIEPGLQLRLWDCTFNDGLFINRGAVATGEKYFLLLCYLNPGSFRINRTTAIEKNKVINDTLFMSSDAPFQVELLPGRPVRCVSIRFSLDWLQRNICNSSFFSSDILNRSGFLSQAFVLFESLSVNERDEAAHFFNQSSPEHLTRFYLRSMAIQFLAGFFSKTVSRLAKAASDDCPHREQIEAVERQIASYVYDGMPCIKILARNIAVSESTLKRYFRRIYGKNIYEYFLEKRMQCARELLIQKNKTVSEAASIMGYENISHFITMFRKYFGILPGELKKAH